MTDPRMLSRRLASVIIGTAFIAACSPTGRSGAPGPAPAPTQTRSAVSPRVVPEPASMTAGSGEPFVVTTATSIVVDAGNAEVSRIAAHLASFLRPSTAFPIQVLTTGATAAGAIALRLTSDAALGPEGYQLTVSRDSVRIAAGAPVGLFHGVQTLRQLMPPQIESDMSLEK